MSEPTRAWLYRIALAVVTLAIVYNVVDQNQAAGWFGLAAALFGNGLATLNTTTKGQ